jgi:PAS domain S-box-containing protein
MLRWLDELSGQGVFVTDTELTLRGWNRWLERHTGLPAESAIGVSLFALYPDLVERGLSRHYTAALAGEVSVLSHRLHRHLLRLASSRKDGSSEPMPQSARIAPLLDAGRVVGTITVIDDVSERVSSEAELRRQIEVAELARIEAEEASRVKDEFLATLSHEIRTPLNAVIGWIKILRGRPVDAGTLAHALEVIDRNASAQAVLIEDMLDMARIVSGKLRIDMGPVDPMAATLAAIDVVAPAAAAKGISLRTSIRPGLPSIQGDGNRIQQIIWNVLSNAVKFTPSGGSVHVRVEQEGRSIAIIIEDTGEGIPGDFLPYIFDRFRQAKSSMSRTHGGLGLGLALVRELAEMQGGQVSATSAGPGLGATFRIVFPAVSAVPLPFHDADQRAAAPDDLTGIRVLVVDDDPDARDLTAAALTASGADVSVVASAQQALARLRDAGDDAPHLLITDLGMAGQDGFALIETVRALDGAIAHVPAMAVTAYAAERDRERARSAGFNLHLAKPITPAALVDAVQRVLGRTV